MPRHEIDICEAFLLIDSIADILTEAVARIAHIERNSATAQCVQPVIDATIQNATVARELANQLIEEIKSQNRWRQN